MKNIYVNKYCWPLLSSWQHGHLCRFFQWGSGASLASGHCRLAISVAEKTKTSIKWAGKQRQDKVHILHFAQVNLRYFSVHHFVPVILLHETITSTIRVVSTCTALKTQVRSREKEGGVLMLSFFPLPSVLQSFSLPHLFHLSCSLHQIIFTGMSVLHSCFTLAYWTSSFLFMMPVYLLLWKRGLSW